MNYLDSESLKQEELTHQALLNDLSLRYGLPEPRLDVLLLLCLLNLRFKDFNSLTQTFGIPPLEPNTNKGEILFDYYTAFFITDIDLTKNTEWRVLLDKLLPYFPKLNTYRKSISLTVLSKTDWYYCQYRNCTMVTPCSMSSCPNFTDSTRTHCDPDKNLETGRDEFLSRIGLEYLGSLKSKLPQYLGEIEESLVFLQEPNVCSVCQERIDYPDKSETFENYTICDLCLSEKPSIVHHIEINFKIPIDVAVRLVESQHSSFDSQAKALGITLSAYGIVRKFLCKPTHQFLIVKDSGKGSKLNFQIIPCLSVGFLETKRLVSQETKNFLQKIILDINEILPGLTYLP